MSACNSCGCSPCQCAGHTVLNQPQIIQPTVTGGTFQSPEINSPNITNGQMSGTQLIGVSIDETSVAFTQPQGTCGPSVATTGFVCTALADAISGLNPDFCAAVDLCISGGGGSLCPAIAACIQNVPDIINVTQAFGPGARATDVNFGVVRYATLVEVQNAACGVSLEPCDLGAFWSAGGPNPLWNAFTAAVLNVVGSDPGFCATVFACGVAPIASPVFTGDPQAPTPAPGDNDTSIATTSFVSTAVSNAISGGNPAFCAAVAACATTGVGNFASATLSFSLDAGGNLLPLSVAVFANYGCVVAPAGGPFGPQINVTFTVPQPNLRYVVSTMTNIVGGLGGFGWNDINPTRAVTQTVLGVGGLGVDYVIPGDPNSSYETTFVFHR